MHSALFVATIPKPAINDWRSFLMGIKSFLVPSENVLRLAENVWLINVSASPSPLGFLISLAVQNSIDYGIIPFQQQPEWLPAELGRGTTLAQSVR